MTVYHISPRFLGMAPLFRPRTPNSRADSEPDTPRICVCKRIEDCYIAFGGWEPTILSGKPIPARHVYRVDAETIPAKGVFDSRSTGERWIVDPVRLTYVGKLPPLRISSKGDMRRNLRETVRFAMSWHLSGRIPNGKNPPKTDQKRGNDTERE